MRRTRDARLALWQTTRSTTTLFVTAVAYSPKCELTARLILSIGPETDESSRRYQN
jgi:hypothetical protein